MLRILPIALAAVLASASVASANDKVVVLLCAASGQLNNVVNCTKSAAYTDSCPAYGTSCAQAIATISGKGLRLLGHTGLPYVPANFIETEYTFQNY